jgi:hypothetical protein
VILLVAVRQLRALNAQGKLSRELVLDPNRDSAAREGLVCPPGRATVSTMARERTIVLLTGHNSNTCDLVCLLRTVFEQPEKIGQASCKGREFAIGLENRCPQGLVGSSPTPSATLTWCFA